MNFANLLRYRLTFRSWMREPLMSWRRRLSGTKRLAGVDLNKVRMRRVVAAVVALSPKPTGFTVSDLARRWPKSPDGTRTLQLAPCGIRSDEDPQQKHGGTSWQVTPLPGDAGWCEKVGRLHDSPRATHQAVDGRSQSSSRTAAQNRSSSRPALPEFARGIVQDFRNLGARCRMRPSKSSDNMLVGRHS